jgi:hypothetical protein
VTVLTERMSTGMGGVEILMWLVDNVISWRAQATESLNGAVAGARQECLILAIQINLSYPLLLHFNVAVAIA